MRVVRLAAFRHICHFWVSYLGAEGSERRNGKNDAGQECQDVVNGRDEDGHSGFLHEHCDFVPLHRVDDALVVVQHQEYIVDAQAECQERYDLKAPSETSNAARNGDLHI